MNIEELLIADYIGVQTNTWLAKIIRVVSTGGDFGEKYREADSHSAMVLLKQGGYLGVDALIGEFGFKGYGTRWIQDVLEKAKKKGWRITFYRINLQYLGDNPARTRAKIVEYFGSLKGKGYDFTLLAGLLLRFSLRLLGPRLYQRSKRIRILLDSRINFSCSEGVATSVKKETGYTPAKGHHLSQHTPYDLQRSYLYTKIACFNGEKEWEGGG